jgi:hypothetical protein
MTYRCRVMSDLLLWGPSLFSMPRGPRCWFGGDGIEGDLNNFFKVTFLFHLSEKVFLGEVKGCFGEVQDPIEVKTQVHPMLMIQAKPF